MDHLVKVVEKVCMDSEIAKTMACGRTKTTAVVKNVLGYHSFQTLRVHLQKSKFSLIVDESTDLSTQKHLCLVVRHVVNYNIVDDYLALINLSAADSQTLYNHVVDFFTNHEIPFKSNLIGFASDGANVMMGEHNSLVALLRKDIPNLYSMKCICHSFHLCASYACQKLPRYVEDLTRDIYNYFGSSPKRTSEFKQFQNFCNVKIHKLLHPSQTRWLSAHAVIARILEQYGALQLYFIDAVSNRDLLAAENILQKLNDPTTKLFLQFLDFVLPFFTNLNKEMQSESPKIHILYKNVTNILKTIYDCFINRNILNTTSVENVDYKNPRNFLPIEDIYFGANVLKSISENKLSPDQLHFFRTRCLDFYVEACTQIIQRFPLKNNPLSKFQFLDPAIVKDGSVQSLTDVVFMLKIPEDNKLQALDTEWRLLRNTEEIQAFPDELLPFWQNVRNIRSGDGTPLFNILIDFVFTILCLPHSSANVERIFSDITLTKTKQRNRLGTDTISGLLHTRRYFRDHSCYDFEIEKKHLMTMNDRSAFYKGEFQNNSDSDEN